MMLALHITGLYSTLLPKLPSKISTVLTANEEDILNPSALQSLYQLLSPAEWSKFLWHALYPKRCTSMKRGGD